MNRNRKPPRIAASSNGELGFEQASHMGWERLDLSRHDQSHLEKLGFAIDAANRWSEFVQSVKQIEELIRHYEEVTRPLLGGPRDE